MRRCLLFTTLVTIVLMLIHAENTVAQAVSIEDVFGQQYRQYSKDTAKVTKLINASAGLRNNPDSALVLLKEAFELSKSIGYRDGCAWSMLGIGTQVFNKGELEKSKAIFRQAYPYCQATTDSRPRILLSWYNNMATTFVDQGNTDSSTYYYYKALASVNRKSRRDSGITSTILSNLSNVWLKASQFDKSLFYSKQALGIAMAMHDSDDMANALQDIGLAMSGTKDSGNCLVPVRLSYMIHLKRHNYKAAEMDCMVFAINTKNNDSALYYYSTALAYSRQTKLPPSHRLYIGLGYTYLDMKRYDSAGYYLNKALERATELKYTNDLTFIYQGLARLYTETKRFELANKYEKEYADLRDSLTNEEKINSANNLEVKYRTADKDRKIAETQVELLKKDNKLKQKNNVIIFVSCFIIILVFVIISIYLYTRRKDKFEKQRVLTIQQGQQIAQLKSLMAGEEKERTRIARELHDGIMVQLAVIKMKLRRAYFSQQYGKTSELNEILQQVDNTSRELRQTAHNLMPDMLLETGLTDALFYYCNNLQKEASLNIIFQHYGSLPRLSQEAELYLYRIVQELLQNILKHAHASKALVQMNYHPPLLSFSVEDNGVGFDDRIMGSGMGLKSIESRLKVLNGTIDIQSTRQRGTTIFIELNIENLIQSKEQSDANTGSYS